MNGFLLGSFRLDRVIGRGGMAQVWRGHHLHSDSPVAVKVMTAETSRGPAFHRAFAEEVRAVASLDHPHIIRLYDAGQVSAEAAAASGGAIEAEAAYLVMELAEGGNLSSHPPPASWPAIKAVLLDLLQALAHAHARGVIHRDIKPANVLWALPREGEPRPRAVLSDFGIAHAGDGGGGGGPTWGTPAYMAPERFTLEWRDLGPWTDLYSVGCLAFTLLRGHPPFKGHPLSEAMQAHLYRPVPSVRAPFPVPLGLDAWLRNMLAKAPQDRFACAADAAWALGELPDPGPGPSSSSSTPREAEPDTQTPLDSSQEPRSWVHAAPVSATGSEGADPTWTDDSFDPRSLAEPRLADPAGGVPRRVGGAPPISDDWREPHEDRARTELPGGGIRLFGLRTIALVDREEERDMLWQALVRVHRTQRAEALLLRGPAGVGKTRLAEWLAERATERGAATALRADHGPEDGIPALARMFASLLRVQGLGRRGLQARTLAWLSTMGQSDEWLAQDLVQLATMGAGLSLNAGLVDVRATTRRVLQLLAARRPLVLLLDDVAWSATSLAFASELLEGRRRLPVLLLLTARGEVLARRPAAAQSLRLLSEEGGMRAIDLEPLRPPCRNELVRDRLGVEPTLAARLAEHGGGNPLFTLTLVREWVSRGLLVESPEGMRPVPDTPLPFPQDMDELARMRLESALGLHDRAERLALMLAATLGHAIDPDEWSLAWNQPAWRALTGTEEPLAHDLVDRLVAERLAVRTIGGWRFVHASTREHLLELAGAEGCRSAAHLAAAAMLAEREAPGGPNLGDRRGRHLAAAGRLAEAAPLLLDAAEASLVLGDLPSSGELLEELAPILDGLPPAERPSLRARWRLARARWSIESEQPELARAQLRGLEEELASQDLAPPARMRGGLLLLQARLALQDGLPNQAARQLDLAHHIDHGNLEMGELAELRRLRGEVMMSMGQVDAAEEALAEAAELFGGIGREGDWARSVIGLARMAAERGELEHAEGLLASAIERCRARRDRLAEADALRVGGTVAMMRGELGLAEERLRRAQAIYQRLGGRRVRACRLARAVLAVQRNRLPEAQRLWSAIHRERPTSLVTQARLAALAMLIAARRGDLLGFDAGAEELSSIQARSGLRLPDVQRLVAQAIRSVSGQGHSETAARARALLG